MRLTILILFCLVSLVSTAQPVADTIRPRQLQLRYLPSGKQSFLVYMQGKDGAKRSIWLWERTTGRENWQGQEAIVIRQQWTSSDTGFNKREIFSVNDAKDFSPLYHAATGPKSRREVFVYRPGSIVGDDTATGNIRKGFLMNTNETALNWELDLETFPLLPLKKGKHFLLNFYHPGSPTAPAWYLYSVTGVETLVMPDGKKVDCYKLFTDYGKNRGNSTWWISQSKQEVLKMEEHFGNITRYKIRLSVNE